jgi:LacI family transcriptional regulator
MATISDVARAAGVSIATVSHVVNDTKPVSQATRLRVDRAITETGYSPHHGARALRRSRTDSVGLVVSDAGHNVFADMVRGIEHEARAAGYVLLLANSATEPDRETQSIRALHDRRVDGLLLAQAPGSDPSLVERLRAWRLPTVLLDRLGPDNVDQIGVENRAAMKDMVTHLISRGHRRIGFVGGDLRIAVLAERRAGYIDGLLAADLPLDDSIVVSNLPTIEAASTIDATATAVRRLLHRSDPPTAIVGASVIHSMGTLRAIKDAGLRIPDDLAFATFDEPAYASLFEPRLTAVVQPAFEVGQEAMRMLIHRIAAPDAPARTVRIRPAIVHRASCGCPPGAAFEPRPASTGLLPAARQRRRRA